MAVGTIRIDLLANTAKFEKSVQSFTKKLDRQLSNVTKRVGQFGVAVTAVGAGLAVLTKKAIDSADKLAKTADKIGTTTEELSKLRFAAEQTGVSSNTLDMAMQRFTRRLAEAAQGTGEAKNALKELNINAESLMQLPLSERMNILADRLKAVENPADRVRIAMKLFDSEGVALVNTLSGGSEQLKKFAEQAERLGIVVDTKTAKASERVNDQLNILGKQFESIGLKIADKVLPYMIELTSRLIHFFDNIDFTYLKTFLQDLDKLAQKILSVVVALGSVVAALKIYSTAIIISAKATEIFNIAVKNNPVMRLAAFLGVLSEAADDNSEGISALIKKIKELGSVELPTPDDKDFKSFVTAFNIPDRKNIELKDDTSGLSEIKFKGVLETTEMEDKLSRLIESNNISESIQKQLTEAWVGDDAIETIQDKMRNFYDNITDYGDQFTNGLQSGLMSMEDAFVKFATTGKLEFSDLANSIIADLARMAIRSSITAPLAEALGGIEWGSMFGFRANGGQVSSSSPYIVGERGPELFVPSSAGAIVPNNRMINGGGSQVNINIENNTGTPISAEQISSIGSNGQQDITIKLMNDIARNKNGIRDMLKGFN